MILIIKPYKLMVSKTIKNELLGFSSLTGK